MVSFPPCKINLGLNIISRRPDGYHDIETCFYPVPWTDILEIIPASEMSFSTSGFRIPGEEKENLSLKAYDLLRQDYSLKPVNIHLHKIIPAGSGLGGGSSDAAWTLRLLNEIFQLKLPVESLQRYASQLGSDSAFFMQDGSLLGAGRGDRLSPVALTLKDFYLVIVRPAVHVSTAEAYAGVHPRKPVKRIKEIIEATPVGQWRDRLFNDFEDSVFQSFPVIGELKRQLYLLGAIYSSMSGSGSGVFGLFNNQVDLKKEFPDCDYWGGKLTF